MLHAVQLGLKVPVASACYVLQPRDGVAHNSNIGLYTLWSICIRGEILTEVVSVRVKKELKLEAEKLGVDLKVAVESLIEELVAEKRRNAERIAKELGSLMKVKPEEWVSDVKATRKEM